MPVCAVAESLLGSSLRSASAAAAVHWGTSPWSRGALACAQLSLCYGSCPSLDKQTASRLQGPLQYPHSPCGDELVPCWLGITVLPPFPSQSSEPPVAMFLPQSPLAFAQLTLKTKVPLMPLGVAQFRHQLPQGYGIQGQPLWQVFAKAQGDLHFFLSVHQPEPLPAQWNLAWSTAGSRTSPEGLPSLPHLAQRTGV